jgi:hypothetical protein
MEMRQIGEIEIEVGIADTYFGAQEDNSELLAMNNAQMFASMVLSKFSIPQIKNKLPGLRNVANAVFTKTVNDTCSRKVRKDFIESLKGQMPRQFTISEYVTLVNEVGMPSSKAQIEDLDKVLRKIKIDMENVDLIVQVRNPKQVTATSRVDVEAKIAKTERSILRSETQIKNLQKKLTSARETLAENAEDKTAEYNAIKAEFNLADAEKELKDKQIKLENLKEVLGQFTVPTENQ